MRALRRAPDPFRTKIEHLAEEIEDHADEEAHESQEKPPARVYFRRLALAGRIGGGRNTLRGLVGVGRRGIRLPVWGPLVFPALVRERRQGRLRVARLRLRHLRRVGGLTAVSGGIVGGEIRVLIAHGCYLSDGCMTTSLGCLREAGCSSGRIPVCGCDQAPTCLSVFTVPLTASTRTCISPMRRGYLRLRPDRVRPQSLSRRRRRAPARGAGWLPRVRPGRSHHSRGRGRPRPQRALHLGDPYEPLTCTSVRIQVRG